MLSHSVTANGEPIMTDILVIGYTRNKMKEYNLLIPIEIQQICYAFWQYIACDIWSTDFHDEDKYEINGDCIKTLQEGGITFYGNHIVKDGQKYVWKLKLNSFPYTGISKYYNPYIGVIVNDNKILQNYSNGDVCEEWTDDGYGYSFIGGCCYLSDWDFSEKCVKVGRDS